MQSEKFQLRGSWSLRFRIRNKETGEIEEFLDEIHNLITTEGFNHMLDAEFHGGSQVDPWYVGLKLTGSAAAGDTYASHAGWTEFAEYSGDRKEFVEGAAANASITNTGSVATFDITSSGQIYGALLCSIASKDSGSGTLFSAGNISSFRTVDSGDQVNITLTIGSGS